MNTIIHTSDSRGHANLGWLDSHHSFSFADYYNPEKIHFGALRVLNDDIVTAGMGFGTHPHDNMEIVSIPLKGTLEHQDSMGNKGIIKKGEVQLMSAGTGIRHSEYNHSKTEPVNFLQLWIIPKVRNITPRYDQKLFDLNGRKNKFQTVVSPDDGNGIRINQDAWISLIDLDENQSVTYQINKTGNGVYLFLLEGNLNAEGIALQKRDAAGITDTTEIRISADTTSELLLIEVPMELS